MWASTIQWLSWYDTLLSISLAICNPSGCDLVCFVGEILLVIMGLSVFVFLGAHSPEGVMVPRMCVSFQFLLLSLGCVLFACDNEILYVMQNPGLTGGLLGRKAMLTEGGTLLLLCCE